MNKPTQQTPVKRSALAGLILSADPSGAKHPYIRDGEYLFEVVKCEERSRQGRAVIIELKVLESKEINSLDTPNPVGEIVSYHNNVDKSESAAGNILAFFMALTGTNNKEDQSFGETVDASLGDEQLASGLKIKGRTFRSVIKKGKNAGQEFVGVNWTHVPPVVTQSEAAKPPASKPRF